MNPARRFWKLFKATLKQWLRGLLRRSVCAPLQLAPEQWGLRALPRGGLEWAGQDLAALAGRFGTPLHVLNARRLDSNFEALGELEVFCSYKTHPVPAVLARLHARGAGAEVISEFELDLALRLGVPPDRIIYNGPAKSDTSLRTAIGAGILLLNLNHREELPRVIGMARELGRKVRLGLRVNTCSGWSEQFGTPIEGGAALALFEAALAAPELEVLGLHSHRGVLFGSLAELDGFIDEALAFADVLHARFGWSPEILDLGGGLAVPTVRMMSWWDLRLARTFSVEIGAPDIRRHLSIQQYSSRVREKVTEHFRRAGRPQPRTVVEIGRALTADAQALLARVITTRESPAQQPFAILDTGINIAGILRGARHQIFPLNCYGQPHTTMYRLAGPICQPGDVIQHAIRLPPLTDGDTLAIMDSGAYFEPDSTVFSFPRPATVMVDGDEVQVIRRRETLDDVIARDRWDP